MKQTQIESSKEIWLQCGIQRCLLYNHNEILFISLNASQLYSHSKNPMKKNKDSSFPNEESLYSKTKVQDKKQLMRFRLVNSP